MTSAGEKCQRCGAVVPGFDGVYLSAGGQQQGFHCSRCYNALLSERFEVDFEHPDFQPITLLDVDGVSHEFRFTTRVLPNGVSIEALEVKDGHPDGYEFRVMGPLEADILELYAKLYERIRKGLSRKHLEVGELGPEISEGDVVRGRIAWDDETGGRIPLLVIDGKSISWEQMGRMLMAYEGFDFKLEIFEQSESK
jgi:hypothetical protein